MNLDTDAYLRKKMLQMDDQQTKTKGKKKATDESPTKAKAEEEEDPSFFLAEFLMKAESQIELEK